MSSVLNTNVASLMASKNLLHAQDKLSASVERLSSGSRINRARDDAAGLGVAQMLTYQINGADQGIRNANDMISMVQTAEGAISAASDMAQRIVVLATQGANSPLSQAQRESIRDEMLKIMSAIDRIADRTEFSGNKLFNFGAYTAQFSADASDKLNFYSGTLASPVVTAFANIGSDNVDEGEDGVAPQDGLAKALKDAIDADTTPEDTDFNAVITAATAYVNSLVKQRSELGAYQNQLEYTVSNLTDLSTNLQAARSRVIDTDYASETAALTRGQILQQAATAMLAQANQMPNVILTLLK